MWLFLLDDKFIDIWEDDTENKTFNKAITFASENLRSTSSMNKAQMCIKKSLGYTEFRNYCLIMFEPKLEMLDDNKVNSYLRAIYKLLWNDLFIPNQQASSISNEMPFSNKTKPKRQNSDFKSFAELLKAYYNDRVNRISSEMLESNMKILKLFEQKLNELLSNGSKGKLKYPSWKRIKNNGVNSRSKERGVKLIKLPCHYKTPHKTNGNLLLHLNSTKRIKNKIRMNSLKKQYFCLSNKFSSMQEESYSPIDQLYSSSSFKEGRGANLLNRSMENIQSEVYCSTTSIGLLKTNQHDYSYRPRGNVLPKFDIVSTQPRYTASNKMRKSRMVSKYLNETKINIIGKTCKLKNSTCQMDKTFTDKEWKKSVFKDFKPTHNMNKTIVSSMDKLQKRNPNNQNYGRDLSAISFYE